MVESNSYLSGLDCRSSQRLGNTFSCWNPDFQAPRLPLGADAHQLPRLPEFTLTVGVEIVMLSVIFQAGDRRVRALWNVMFMAVVGYYGGWWLPWPLLDLHAPTLAAEVDHLVATLLSLAGVAFAWKHFSEPHPE